MNESKSSWWTWVQDRDSREWTNYRRPGWSIRDVPGGHEIRKDGEVVTFVPGKFTEAVDLIDGAIESAGSIPTGEPGQPYRPGEPWKMTWTHPGLKGGE